MLGPGDKIKYRTIFFNQISMLKHIVVMAIGT